MATNESGQTRRLAFYVSQLLQGQAVRYDSVAQNQPQWNFAGIQERMFAYDMSLLKELVPLVFPGQQLHHPRGTAYYHLVRAATPRAPEAETAFVPFAAAMLDQTNLFPYEADVGLANLIQRYNENRHSPLKGRILYKSSPRPAKRNPRVYQVLAEGLAQQRQVRLQYRAATGRSSTPVIEPLLFINVNGVWYLLAQSLDRQGQPHPEPTQFKLDRILRAELSPHPYTSRYDLADLQRRYFQVFGTHLGNHFPEGIVTATIEFSGAAALFANENLFHPGQEAPEMCHQGGDLDKVRAVVRLKLRNFDEAVYLCLSWGTQARPLSPPAFVEAWRAQIRDLSHFCTEGA